MKKPFYIYGIQPVAEALENNPTNVKQVFIKNDNGEESVRGGILGLLRENKTRTHYVAEKRLREYVGNINTQGVVAELVQFEYAELKDWLGELDLDSNPSVLVLDHIEDPHNFGAMVRSAVATGVSGIIIGKDKQSPVNATVFKTSSGTISKIPIIQVSNIANALDILKKNKFWIAGLTMEGKHNLWNLDMDGPMAFVVGAEGKGLSRIAYEKSDFGVSLPMERDVESLNVSVAAAVILYEWKRRKSL